MSWKQPIPTNVRINENIDTLTRLIYLDVIHSCQNKDKLFHFWHGNKEYHVELKRGQCIFAVDRIARELEIGHRRVRKTLDTISKWETNLEIKRMPFGLIVTVKDYDEITKIEINPEIKGKSKGNQREIKGKASNKSVKSVESVESVKHIYDEFIEGFNKTVGGEHRGDSRSQASFKARLRDGFTIDEILRAVENASRNKYLMGDNDQGKRYLTPEYILRSNKLDEWLSSSAPCRVESKKKGPALIVETRRVS